ncbi:PDDEXK nuclease domain-containing protein [Arachidicoccus terrestris]|uniref:PDDEXK nuclease domain-containing protein n=1 Tax=Arachidicoccus terrestris TaxID=2875539 RepID=UPI0021D3F3BC|nr:PDDEXK nuclease domain-containing protein [Arachidicoccus terrestris]UAY55663.1 PDDEXK nuclease domain-containing protein [Arachidicoccus terrestris]
MVKTFLSVGFTHHVVIVNSIKDFDIRWFYLKIAANRFWSVSVLKKQIKERAHEKINPKHHNFELTIPEKSIKDNALNAFKDEMLLDFINLEDEDEEPDERVLEKEIVQNIKHFIMALGPDFSFIGNQFRLIIEGEEFFIDLVFFNRTLQSLIAIELKKGKFKGEYLGKMNLYLTGLDEYVKKVT